MARDPNDVFDDYDDWNDKIDGPRKRGRPATRRTSAKGPNGRPRIRPLEDKYSRRGRPTLNAGSVADRIEKQALIEGGYFNNSVAVTMKGFDKSIGAFQTKIVEPLAKSIRTFANSVNQFNAYHQQYLKDQIAFSRDMYNTFKSYRKLAIDPFIAAMAKTRKFTGFMADTTEGIRNSGRTSKSFQRLADKIQKTDDTLKDYLRGSIVTVEAIDTGFKEFYKTSKATSKFLNAISYAAEDIAEDIESLKNNVNKLFKGKRNISVLQDHTETLKKIEKNTAAPSMGKRILSSLFSGAIALGKTALKYNRYGTTQFLSGALGIDVPNVDKNAKSFKFGEQLTKVITDAYDIAIRQKVRDANGKLRYTYQQAELGMYGGVGQKAAQAVRVVGGKTKYVVDSIKRAWNESSTKQWANWFWKVGETYLINYVSSVGERTERQISGEMTNYMNHGKPTQGYNYDYMEKLLRYVEEINEKGIKIRYDQLEGIPGMGPKTKNKKNRRNGNVIYPEWSLPNPIANLPDVNGFTFDNLNNWVPYGNISKTFNDKKAMLYRGLNTFSDRVKSTKGSFMSSLGESKEEEQAWFHNFWGKGSGVVTFESKSEQDINAADVSTPKKALGSITKLLGRMTGYLKKIWHKEGGTTVQEKSKGLIDNLLDAGGGLAAGAGAWFGGTKIGQFFGNLTKGWKGKAGLAGLAALGLSPLALKHAKLGGTLRTLWDIFGFGSVKSQGHMTAMSLFKQTKLARSPIGNLIRRANIAMYGFGKDPGSRILAGAIEGNKWGGFRDLTGWTAGILKGAGLSRAKGAKWWELNKYNFQGRRNIPHLGGVNVPKGGTRLANLAKAEKVAEEVAKFAEKHPIIAANMGDGFLGKTTALATNVAGGVLNTGKNVAKGAWWLGKGTVKNAWGLAKGLGAGAWGLAKGAGNKTKAAGSLLSKIPSRDRLLGMLASTVLGGGVAKLAENKNVAKVGGKLAEHLPMLKPLAKLGGKGVAKVLAKQIPILGAIIGIGFGITRFTQGDVLGGILEITSGLLTLVPSGAGNAAALGIDATLIARDAYKKGKDSDKYGAKIEDWKDKIYKAFGVKKDGKVRAVLDAYEDTMVNGTVDDAKKLAKTAMTPEAIIIENNKKKAENPLDKAKGSDYNPVSKSQGANITPQGKNPISKVQDGENPYVESLADEESKKNPGKKRTFVQFVKDVRAVQNLRNWSDANLGTGAAPGEKKVVTSDTGAIAWNGRRHDRLMPKFQKALFSAADEMYRNTGHRVNITDAIRTDEEQARLYWRWKNGDKNVFTPALPVNDYPQYKITGTHNNNRSGHLVGGAVDVSNWREFKPYALKYGLHWHGAKDPVHFQINDTAPVITNAVIKQSPPPKSTTPQPTKVGDGDSYMNSTQPFAGTAGSGNSTPNNSTNVQTDISPMIQDYGLAIINNLLFA